MYNSDSECKIVQSNVLIGYERQKERQKIVNVYKLSIIHYFIELSWSSDFQMQTQF